MYKSSRPVEVAVSMLELQTIYGKNGTRHHCYQPPSQTLLLSVAQWWSWRLRQPVRRQWQCPMSYDQPVLRLQDTDDVPRPMSVLHQYQQKAIGDHWVCLALCTVQGRLSPRSDGASFPFLLNFPLPTPSFATVPSVAPSLSLPPPVASVSFTSMFTLLCRWLPSSSRHHQH